MPEARDHDEIMRANRMAGERWFTPGVMRGFDSRLEGSTFYAGWVRTVFITSEKGPTGPRAFAVRISLRDGTVQTLTATRAHATYREASAWATILADLLKRRVDIDTLHARWRDFEGPRP